MTCGSYYCFHLEYFAHKSFSQLPLHWSNFVLYRHYPSAIEPNQLPEPFGMSGVDWSGAQIGRSLGSVVEIWLSGDKGNCSSSLAGLGMPSHSSSVPRQLSSESIAVEEAFSRAGDVIVCVAKSCRIFSGFIAVGSSVLILDLPPSSFLTLMVTVPCIFRPFQDASFHLVDLRPMPQPYSSSVVASYKCKVPVFNSFSANNSFCENLA